MVSMWPMNPFESVGLSLDGLRMSKGSNFVTRNALISSKPVTSRLGSV